MQQYKIITLTHKQLSLSQIGRFIISAENNEAIAAKLEAIKTICNFEELFYLATCNRVMFLFVTNRTLTSDFIENFLYLLNAKVPHQELKQIAKAATVYKNEKAVQHIFEVASSIESLVIGEREILRQLREAYNTCRQHHLTGDKIRMLIDTAVQVAKKVYNQTRIGEKPLSVVSLAGTELLKRNISKDARFLIIGAGQTNHLMAKFLLKHGFKNFAIYNRSLENAEKLAAKMRGSANTLEQLTAHKQPFDVLLTCTGATNPIVTEFLYKNLIKSDTSLKLILDLAVPKDVEEKVIQNNAVDYIEIEKLRELAAENLNFRKKEITGAKRIIKTALEEFHGILDQRKLELALSEIPTQVKALKERALSQVFYREINDLDEQSQEVLHKILSYMEKKYISIPITSAKNKLLKTN